jgi:hypothetical protein
VSLLGYADGCPRNIKHFLIFIWEGPHDIRKENFRISRWGGNSWHKYEINATCSRCGVTLNRFGVNEIELLRAGFAKEELP